MDKPLTKWYCDKCGHAIETAQEGYVTWDCDDQNRATGFQIIHAVKCDNNAQTASSALEDFLGVDGLSHALSILSLGPIRIKHGGKVSQRVSDLDEFVDFVRRVQTPHYEEARRNFSDHELRQDYYDANEIAPYRQDDLVHIIEKYSPKD